jgi:S-adenosyl-L-methionine hydrolase (adenosine-forming)
VAALVTLTTDFGARDPYVAAMKGVILSIAPEAAIVDLSHEIAPGDIAEAALFLAATLPYFPHGAIHVAVIDPGVGTARRAVAARIGDGYFVGPDNGLLTLVAKRLDLAAMRVIDNPTVMRPAISPTFHGRDIFAPAAAHLARGFAFDQLGGGVEAPVELAWPEPVPIAHEAYQGRIVHIDRFGNAVTNVPADWIAAPARAWLSFGDHRLDGIRTTYADVPAGQPLALAGSTGYLEISINGDHAANRLGLQRGDAITVGGAGLIDAGHAALDPSAAKR